MPVTYHLTPDAQSDLIGIHRFTLAQWGTTQSKTYLSGLRQTIQLLAETPTLGMCLASLIQVMSSITSNMSINSLYLGSYIKVWFHLHISRSGKLFDVVK